MNSDREADAIRQRYARRRETGLDSLYDPLRPSVYLPHQERERVLIRRILKPYLQPLETRRLIEIGCGSGANLIHLLRLGFRPDLVANELLDERVEAARNLLPEAIEIIPGDATRIERPGAFDAVLLSTVFTSILDDAFQKALADKAWELVKSGGGIIWYDFVFDNPVNSDVRGVKLKRIKELFPNASINAYRVTLAPPIARRITAIHPALYNLVNCIPLLRSHLLCWIAKP